MKSGIPGVTWYAPLNKWCARLHRRGYTLHIGYFDTPLAAHKALIKASHKPWYIRALMWVLSHFNRQGV